MGGNELKSPASLDCAPLTSVGVTTNCPKAVSCGFAASSSASSGTEDKELLAYYPIIRDFLRRFESRVVSADDLAQVTYFKAYRGLERGSVPRDKRSWLLSIARNVGYEQFRKDQRYRGVTLDDRLEAILYEESVGEPIETILSQEEKLRLRRVLDSLTRQEQLFVHAYYAPDRRMFDVATQFGISGELAKVRMYRLRKKLRRLLME